MHRGYYDRIKIGKKMKYILQSIELYIKVYSHVVVMMRCERVTNSGTEINTLFEYGQSDIVRTVGICGECS